MEGVKQEAGNRLTSVEALNVSSATKDGQPERLSYNHADAWAERGKIFLPLGKKLRI
jgi:hypothetical protein